MWEAVYTDGIIGGLIFLGLYSSLCYFAIILGAFNTEKQFNEATKAGVKIGLVGTLSGVIHGLARWYTPINGTIIWVAVVIAALAITNSTLEKEDERN